MQNKWHVRIELVKINNKEEKPWEWISLGFKS